MCIRDSTHTHLETNDKTSFCVIMYAFLNTKNNNDKVIRETKKKFQSLSHSQIYRIIKKRIREDT